MKNQKNQKTNPYKNKKHKKTTTTLHNKKKRKVCNASCNMHKSGY